MTQQKRVPGTAIVSRCSLDNQPRDSGGAEYVSWSDPIVDAGGSSWLWISFEGTKRFVGSCSGVWRKCVWEHHRCVKMYVSCMSAVMDSDWSRDDSVSIARL